MEVRIIRKRIKNIYLRVRDDGNAEVSAPYWYTDKEIMDFVRSREGWLVKAGKRAERRRDSEPEYLTHPELKEAARRALKARLEKRVSMMEELTGFRCSGWTVRDMKTRWGSCNTQTKKITFNLRLVNRSDEELDYIILHELCHTRVRNHGQDFWKLVESFMPDWKKRRNSLRNS